MARTKLLTPNFNLTRRTDGYYIIRYQEDGKTINKATGTKDAREAEVMRAQFVQDYRKPKLGNDPTVAEVIDLYLHSREGQIAAMESVRYSLASPKRLLGSLTAESITQTVVNGYITQRGSEDKGGLQSRKTRPVSEATISKDLRALRAALNHAAAEKLIQPPAFRIELSQGKTRDRWITKDEANRLMEVAAPHMALFLLVSLSTAKRREAVLTLTWDRVDLSRPGHESLDFGDDVGNKRRGKTPIAGNQRLILALRKAKEAAVTDYVIEYKGAPVASVKTALSATCRRAGVGDITTHTLKHSAVTWMVQAGVPFERIAKFTNTTKEMIERVYGHHSPEFVSEAVMAVSF